MDTLILYKAYREYIAEPECPNGDLCDPRDRHAANIAFLEMNMRLTKESFCGVMAHIKYNLSRRLKDGCRLIDDPKLGGHYYVYSDDFEQIEQEAVRAWERAERLYALILDSEHDIAEEYALREREKDKEILREIRRKEFMNTPAILIKSCKQLSLFKT